MSAVTAEDVARAAVSFVGDIEQVPPMVSAVKVGGRRLHELARAGVEVDRPARPVHVYPLAGTPAASPSAGPLEGEGSAGTYGRVAGAGPRPALGGGAHLPSPRPAPPPRAP